MTASAPHRQSGGNGPLSKMGYDEDMKALALLIALLSVGDLAVNHGTGLRTVCHAAGAFSHATASAFHDSFFAA